LNVEAQQLSDEIQRVASSTTFNGVNLLDGSFLAQQFQVGANAGETISVNDVVNAQTSNLGANSLAVDVGGTITTFVDLVAGNFTIDDSTGAAIDVGAITSTSVADHAEKLRVAINAISSQTDVYATLDAAGTALTLTSDRAIDFDLSGAPGVIANVGFATGNNTEALAAVTGFSTLDVSSVGGANVAIQTMDSALNAVNTARANLGALQSRFASVVANLSINSENLSAARSRIRDADFAAETASLTRAQILQQAGTAMLAQANSVPQNVLSLLG